MKKDGKIVPLFSGGKRYRAILGRVHDTGLPIDGHTLGLTLWEYDRESWHLSWWGEENDEAVMETLFLCLTMAGMESDDSREAFVRTWKAHEFEWPGAFCIDTDKVDIIQDAGGRESDAVQTGRMDG